MALTDLVVVHRTIQPSSIRRSFSTANQRCQRSNTEKSSYRKLTQLEEPKNAPEHELQKLRAVQVQTRCFRVQMKLDEYVNGESRDAMTLDKISSSANHPLTAAESLHPNNVQLLLTRAQYQATVSENTMAAKGTLQRAKGIGARKTVAPHLALAQVRLVHCPASASQSVQIRVGETSRSQLGYDLMSSLNYIPLHQNVPVCAAALQEWGVPPGSAIADRGARPRARVTMLQ